MNNIINVKERKIRNYWLASTLSLFVVTPFLLFLLSVFFFTNDTISTFTTVLVGPSVALLVMLAPTLIGSIVALLLWYCTYKHAGKNFLTFCLVIFHIPYIVLIESGPIVGVALYSVFVVWFFLSLRIREINKSIQEGLEVSKDM